MSVLRAERGRLRLHSQILCFQCIGRMRIPLSGLPTRRMQSLSASLPIPASRRVVTDDVHARTETLPPMLNPRSHPIHQETDRLKVGNFIVDVPRREVACETGGEPMRLTVKALHVLLALSGQAGKVVSREALLEWVWPDTLPTDDVLTQAIGQLRKAFGDDRESPRYLETISKGGYRLIAPFQWLETESAVQVVPAAAMPETAKSPIAMPTPSRAANTTGPSTKRRRLALVGGAALAIAMLASVFQLTRRAVAAGAGIHRACKASWMRPGSGSASFRRRSRSSASTRSG